ncbi:hypothetical protein [Halocynthiibacter styelae]|uniref:Uncharacterized protein n=1 Tax=Halocynthiibacter styelae TaxID=2761955 RepID=A0A8J7LVS4_9RHOB|nr:hypothetical protein [Paenihalocynthiibacter styelae]MBI1493432.1 hypothetical protein [Paenihalocynthiibacter styelae]
MAGFECFALCGLSLVALGVKTQPCKQEGHSRTESGPDRRFGGDVLKHQRPPNCFAIASSPNADAASARHGHVMNSAKRRQSINTDMNWSAMEIDRLTDSLHAKAVNVGIADLRKPEHYAAKSYRPSAFHEYHHQPEKPRCMEETA